MPKQKQMFQKTLWPLGSVGKCLEGGRWAGLQSAASKSVVPGGCPLKWGPPREGQGALSRGGEQAWGHNQSSVLNLYVCVCVKPQKGERHRIAPNMAQSPPFQGFCSRTHRITSPPGRASPPEHRERRPERRRPLPGSPTTRQNRRCACAGGTRCAGGLYVITSATPRRTACDLLFGKVQ